MAKRSDPSARLASHRQTASALADTICEYRDALEGLLFLRRLGPLGAPGVAGVLRSKPIRVLAHSWEVVEAIAEPEVDVRELICEFIPEAMVDDARAALFGEI
jgi:hypothetical protein